MGLELQWQVLRRFHGAAAEKLALLCFALIADDATGTVWVSVQGVARFTDLDTRTVRRAVRALEGAPDAPPTPGKWLFPVGKPSRQGQTIATTYRVQPPPLESRGDEVGRHAPPSGGTPYTDGRHAPGGGVGRAALPSGTTPDHDGRHAPGGTGATPHNNPSQPVRTEEGTTPGAGVVLSESQDRGQAPRTPQEDTQEGGKPGAETNRLGGYRATADEMRAKMTKHHTRTTTND